MKESKETNLEEIHILEQSMQGINAQKQQFSAQLLEIESAVSELSLSKESYRIVGNIMIKKDPGRLKEELVKKKEIIEIRIKSFENQESKIVEKIRKIQKEVLDG